MNQKNEGTQWYVQQFKQMEARMNGEKTAPIHQLRQAAVSRFEAMGFPTTHQEEWKYTNVKPIASQQFDPAIENKGTALKLKKQELEAFLFPQLKCFQLVFLDGHFSPALSCLDTLPEGLQIESLANPSPKTTDWLLQYLTQHAQGKDAFVALNTAFLYEGAYIHLGANLSLERPIHCLFVSTPNAEKLAIQPYNILSVGLGSRVTFIESYVSLGSAQYFTNTVTEILLNENARLDYYKLQHESSNAFHIGTTTVQQSRGSQFYSTSISTGAELGRHNLNVLLNGEDVFCQLNGLYFAQGNQLLDHHTFIDHAKPHGTSQEFYKGIIDDQARAVFNGIILVRKDSQKTDSRQTNKNLLLSETAMVDTKPQLEILANDVKCAHGATVGQIDKNALFYLRSRGIGLAESRKLLTYAFALEVLQKISHEPIREALETLIQSRLQKNTSNTSVSSLTEPQRPFSELLLLRKDFPILYQNVHGKPLVYLDNAASTQKPVEVIRTIQEYYEQYNANIHRGVHYLSQKATDLYEKAREDVRRFLNASRIQEIIYTRGTTEGINLVAHSFVRPQLRPHDEILISAMEHHSNIVPWQILCEETGAKLRVIPMNSQGELLLDQYVSLLSERTKIVSIVHLSNALGTINPIRKMIQIAHEHHVPVLIDGAQAVSHLPVDVQQLDCDFYVFSGHKLFAPTGIGILYGKMSLLEKMRPYQGGGDMIRSVSFEKTTYNDLPYRFEAGTPHIEGGIGLGAAIRYLQKIGLSKIKAYEQQLLHYAMNALGKVPGIQFVGTAKEKASVVSFTLKEIHPHDIGTILDQEGIAIRTGHHCAQPVMQFFGIPATARASLAFYNTPEDIDALVQGLHQVLEVFA